MGFSFTSFLFETVNFVVLLWVLSRLVYKPLKKSLEARRSAEEERARATASQMREVQEQRDELLRRDRELGELRERVMREATEEAAEARARLIEEAKQDAASDLARGQTLLESERRAAEIRLHELAIEQSTRIAARLLAELAPAAVDDALIERLVQAVRAHAGELRREAEANRPPEVDVCFARPPKETDVERLRHAFVEAFGARPRLVTREDPSLVAGVVATVGHRVLDASVSGNLALLAERARELSEPASHG